MAGVVKLWEWLRSHWGYERAVAEFELRQSQPREEHEMSHDADLDMGADVTPIRKLQPGDILDVVQKLRRLMTSAETASYTLYASFEELGDRALEVEAEKARHTMELATARVYSLLAAIERTPSYVAMRQETLARRGDRSRKTERNT